MRSRVRSLVRYALPVRERDRLARSVRRRRLSYLSVEALGDLWDAVRDADERGLPGALLEAGTALGGSAVMLGRARTTPRPLHLYDVFGMIPPPGEEDGPEVHARYREIEAGRSAGIGGDRYYGYEPDLRAQVAATLESFGVDMASVQLTQGLYEDTLHPDGEVAVAHIDCDWYASVRTCLDRTWPALVVGGRLVIDDYDVWDGCRRAVDEFLAEVGDEARIERRARLHVVRARR